VHVTGRPKMRGYCAKCRARRRTHSAAPRLRWPTIPPAPWRLRRRSKGRLGCLAAGQRRLVASQICGELRPQSVFVDPVGKPPVWRRAPGRGVHALLTSVGELARPWTFCRRPCGRAVPFECNCRSFFPVPAGTPVTGTHPPLAEVGCTHTDSGCSTERPGGPPLSPYPPLSQSRALRFHLPGCWSAGGPVSVTAVAAAVLAPINSGSSTD
jgi:hypothetical protein